MMPSSKVGAVKGNTIIMEAPTLLKVGAVKGNTVIMEETYDALEQGGGG